jgi:ribosomal protein L29
MKKTAQIKEIRAKETKTLIKELADLNVKLTDLQFKASFQRLKNFHEITIVRKQIARIWTIMGEKTAESLSKETK